MRDQKASPGPGTYVDPIQVPSKTFHRKPSKFLDMQIPETKSSLSPAAKKKALTNPCTTRVGFFAAPRNRDLASDMILFQRNPPPMTFGKGITTEQTPSCRQSHNKLEVKLGQVSLQKTFHIPRKSPSHQISQERHTMTNWTMGTKLDTDSLASNSLIT